jgi:transposase
VFLEDLQALAERRLDLNKSLVQEKNRSQAPTVTPWIQKSCQAVIKVLKDELECVLTAMNVLLETCPELAKRKEVLQSIAGIGEVISMQLIALLPELGYLNRRAIASLVGLAPHPNESGTKTGQRRTKGGRQHVRNILFMAGMSAIRSKSFIGAYYQGLIARGKKKMVALVAVMRKIIVIANARIKDALKLEGVVFDGSIGASRP